MPAEDQGILSPSTKGGCSSTTWDRRGYTHFHLLAVHLWRRKLLYMIENTVRHRTVNESVNSTMVFLGTTSLSIQLLH